MKPLHLELQAFGPFVERQSVDFEDLARQGMFLIKGETGSGKTTLFDGMTFALYGGSSGDATARGSKTGRNKLEEWRCSQAQPNAVTEVSLTFSVQGRTYRFTRKLEPKTKNLNPKYEAVEILEDGNEIPLFENPKETDLNRKAEELTGLTKEQFRQVVMLPQGQFERFLVAGAEEKEAVLQKIFGTELWSSYAKNLYDAAAQKKKDLDRDHEDVLRSLQEVGLAGLPGLDEKMAEYLSQEEALEENHRLFEGDRKRELLNRDREIAERYKPLHNLEKNYALLLSKEQEMKRKEDLSREADKAETLRTPIGEYENAKKIRTERNGILEEKRRKIPAAADKAAQLLKEKETHEANSPLAEAQRKIGEYTGKMGDYDAFTGLSSQLKNKQQALENAKKAAASAEETLTQEKEKAEQAARFLQEATAVMQDYQNRYLGGIYGELAAELAEGTPCPVCGSCEHPNPAKRREESVTRESWERKKKEQESADRAYRQAEERKTAAADKKQSCDTALSAALQEMTAAKTAYDTAKDHLIPGISTRTDLERELAALEKTIKDYNDKSARLSEAYQSARQEQTRAESDCAAAEEELRKAKEREETLLSALETAIQEKGYPDLESVKEKMLPPDMRSAMQKEIVEYHTNRDRTKEELEKTRQELAGTEEPDANLFRQREEELNKELADYTKALAELRANRKQLKKKKEDLTDKENRYLSQIDQARDDLAFATRVRGDSGIGLQRYVLAVMFNQVIGEANRMLSHVHGGRYQLYRSDDKGVGNKRGLELKVHDNRSPEKEGRSVSMLSGGEKFLVSLALSIGLSSVTERSGVQIESLFIDEGFGTLDDTSIQDAMEVLDSVRKSNGTIGIISHVRLLEDNIPTHLEVVKSEKGNYIRMD